MNNEHITLKIAKQTYTDQEYNNIPTIQILDDMFEAKNILLINDNEIWDMCKPSRPIELEIAIDLKNGKRLFYTCYGSEMDNIKHFLKWYRKRKNNNN